MGTLKNAIAGGIAGGPLGAVVGGATGLLEDDRQKGQETLDGMVGALDRGKQQVLDMRNGIGMDDSDRSLIADSIDQGYGVY